MHPALQTLVDDIVRPRAETPDYEASLRSTGISVLWHGWRLAGCIGFDGKPVGSGKNRPTFTTIDEAGRWFDGLTPIDLPKTERNSPP